MLRQLLTIIFLAAFVGAHAQPPANQPVAELSTVYALRNPDAIKDLEENPAATARMVNQLVQAVTGKKDPASAWRSLVTPKDRVGIKVSAAGGRHYSTHPGVVNAIIAGLESAGIPRNKIVVWDRDLARLNDAQFVQKRDGYQLRSITGVADYDRDAVFLAPTLGRLIWGDVLFSEKQRHSLGRKPAEGELLSSSSFIASILSRQVTKVINVPVLSDEAGCGVAGALYNMTIPNVDNWRRFLQNQHAASDSIAALYADEHIGPKVVLHLMDGLIAQYAKGPNGDGNYSFAHKTLYASTDPVALDANALRLLEGWRAEANLPPIGPRASWLQAAAEMDLGNNEKVQIKDLTPQSTPPAEPRTIPQTKPQT